MTEKYILKKLKQEYGNSSLGIATHSKEICTYTKIKDPENYNDLECWRNAFQIYTKMNKLKPRIIRGNRKVNNKYERNPHYWCEIRGAVWDVNKVLKITSDFPEFHYIIYKNKQDFYDAYNIINKKDYTTKTIMGL